mmetsp:Transcript_22129/g.59071  ORF Transcript_22129/g.59071 Transcript_22129/m.59071 type:complete len:169 (+) Transcript_22129:87-593(+)
MMCRVFGPLMVMLLAALQVLVVIAEAGEAGFSAGPHSTPASPRVESTAVSASSQRESLRGSRAPDARENSSETWAASLNVTTPTDSTQTPSIETQDLVTKDVYCICKVSPRELQCGTMFYTLTSCDRSCRRVCHEKGFRWRGCDGVRSVTWYQRLHYKWTTCPDDPLR